MKRIIYKTRAVGPSTFTVGLYKNAFQIQTLLLYLPDLGFNFNPSVLIGQISFVEFQKTFMKQITKPADTRVITKRLSDVIDHDACVLLARVWNEQNPIEGGVFWSNVDQSSVWPLPNGVKLSFNKNAPPLGDHPAYQLFSAVSGNMLWNDRETFVQWLIGEGLYWNIERLAAGNNFPTKSFNVTVE